MLATVTAAPDVVFGRVPKPDIIDLTVAKPASDGAGFTRLSGPRQIVGTCHHRTEGRDTPESVAALFATNGERQWDALTDFVIGLDGRIARLNDIYGTRMPWANGGSDGLEGDGPAFVAKFGVFGINAQLASIEHCGLFDDPVPAEQLEASAQLTAYIHDGAGVRWDAFPLHQDYGVVTQLQHYEFATKDCPGGAFRGLTDTVQNRARAIMQAAQTTVVEPTTPPPAPVRPVIPYATPNDLAFAARQFGAMVDRRGDTPVTRPYDLKGVVSRAWAQRAFTERMFPAGEEIRRVPIGTDASGAPRFVDEAVFANGWVLSFDSAQPRKGWDWAGAA